MISTHLIIVRACDEDVEGACAQVKVGFAREPDQDVLDRYRDATVKMFRESVGNDPARVAVVVLPWCAEQDGEEA